MTPLPFAPRLCLSMIVRNEAAVIARCLASVRPAIGAWAIVDTGSNDGTQAIVRELLSDLPGELIERPWVDFATNRNQALELARRHGDYALVIDADEVLEIEAASAPAALAAPGYYVRQRLADSAFEYWSPKLLRHDQPWRWQGVLHEYPALAPGHAPLPKLDALRVRSFSDGARSRRPVRDKYLDDARVLQQALAREPGNARYAFYLAQSLRDAGEHAEALAAYRARIELGGWDEEVWYARFQVAVLLERSGAAAADIEAAYLAAWESRPSRAEPLCELARMLRLQGRYAAAHLYASHAVAIPEPGDLLFIDRAVYRWRARDEQAISAYYVGRIDECAALNRVLLADPALPEAERPRIERNLSFCVPHD